MFILLEMPCRPEPYFGAGGMFSECAALRGCMCDEMTEIMSKNENTGVTMETRQTMRNCIKKQ